MAYIFAPNANLLDTADTANLSHSYRSADRKCKNQSLPVGRQMSCLKSLKNELLSHWHTLGITTRYANELELHAKWHCSIESLKLDKKYSQQSACPQRMSTVAPTKKRHRCVPWLHSMFENHRVSKRNWPAKLVVYQSTSNIVCLIAKESSYSGFLCKFWIVIKAILIMWKLCPGFAGLF